MHKTKTEFKGEIDKFTIMAGDFNTPFNNLQNKETKSAGIEKTGETLSTNLT